MSRKKFIEHDDSYGRSPRVTFSRHPEKTIFCQFALSNPSQQVKASLWPSIMAERDMGLDERHAGPDGVPLLNMRGHEDSASEADDEEEQGAAARGLPPPGYPKTRNRQGSTWMKQIGSILSFSKFGNEGQKRMSKTSVRSRLCQVFGYSLAIVLMLLSVVFLHLFNLVLTYCSRGIIQLVSIAFIFLTALFPDQAAWFRDHFGNPSKATKGLLHWPTDFSRDIQPVPCHSHNDYWRQYPLYSALKAGCIGVEADVWLIDDELFVGHSYSSLTTNRTLRSLYVNPLMEILGKQNPVTEFHPKLDAPRNGVFDTNAEQTLVLMIDFKTNGAALWPHVYAQLEPLRTAGYLTSVKDTSITPGPITVVATGEAPFDLVVANTTRDIFFDAPLASMDANDAEMVPNDGEGHSSSGRWAADFYVYNATNSFYASTDFSNAIGSIWSEPNTSQLSQIRSQIQAAHDRGLKARYWDTPSWPRGLRNQIWNILVREGADFLNVDDLRDATQGNWGEW